MVKNTSYHVVCQSNDSYLCTLDLVLVTCLDSHACCFTRTADAFIVAVAVAAAATAHRVHVLKS